MSRLARNFTANFAFSASTALIGLLVIPLYIRFLGVEPYGLIAFYVALRGVLQIFDLGMGSVVNREFARELASPDPHPDRRDALRTFEAIYWLFGIVAGAILILAAPLIAQSWLKAELLSTEKVVSAVRLTGVVVALQWPAMYYQNALLGLERHLSLNVVLVSTAAALHGVALLLTVTIWRDVNAFFLCAIAAYALQTGTLALLAARAGSSGGRGRFRVNALRYVSRFAVGVGGISVAGAALAQVDKLVLSTVLSLSVFAYYSLATVVAGALTIVVTPIFNTFYPRFSSLIASGRDSDLRALHHFGAQLLTVAIAPAALMLLFFGRALIEIWTGSAATAAAVAPVAVLLAMGTAINGVMTLLYAQQLAHGWTRLAFGYAVGALIGYVPLLVYAASHYAAIGAAACWLLMNVTYFAIVAPLTFRRLMPGAFSQWALSDILLPAGAATAVIGLAAVLFPRTAAPAIRILLAVAVYGAATAAAAAASSRLRNWFFMRRSVLRAARS